jgi:hypothetical protein
MPRQRHTDTCPAPLLAPHHSLQGCGVPFVGGTGSAACPTTGAATVPAAAGGAAPPTPPPPSAPQQANASKAAGGVREGLREKIEDRVDCKLHPLKCLKDRKGEQGKSG